MIEDIIRSGVEQFTDELEQNSADYKRAVNELDEIEDINDSENEAFNESLNEVPYSNILSEEELKEAQEIKKHCKGE